ncbi:MULTISPECIES: DNA-binding protein [Pectobacterium]|uniref:DNA-binding protein n=1 Tax=Pectobacterium TaxID=122277 RepID=UPI0018DAD5A8|nr:MULTISPECIES: DNA-binding protein [Pectobacterium]QPI44550.1 DNA-binding protein [Pectobacterium aroidearum]UUE58983.1 DNA-binding protein [Pectobacterium aroidearum]UUE71810.1 DNA-binding protein [Pectobacterium aroidearum]UUE76211.1 DNA-binding protein [Pectobacterium aroidearum]UUE80436.1 DNA-binding protein [Pectobacterium aroidearum]
MSNIFIFEPINTNDPHKNTAKFIEFCKTTIFNSTLVTSWESNIWKKFYRFNKFDMKRNSNSREPLDDCFIDFAKAYMLHVHSFNKAKSKPTTLAMLKIVEFVLLKLTMKANVTNCNNLVFDECVRLASEKYSKEHACFIGKELENLSIFLSENRMTNSSYLFWVNPLRRKVTQTWSGYEPSLEGHSRLPDIKSVIAIAEIFSKDDKQLSPKDIFTTSVLALLMCAPGRISEILGLPEDCEITENDSKGIQRYGLRFFSAKGYEGDIKWIPTAMIPVAKKAISRLRKLSSQARLLAIKIESNQSESLEKTLRENIPEDFPWYDAEKNIKYSNALCLLNEGQLCKRKSVKLDRLFRPTTHFFIDSANIKGDSNIFNRHHYLNEDGSPYLLRTHQLRHLLNTFSQINGMDEFSIARWSGRKLISQNVSYDHRSHLQMSKLIRDERSSVITNTHRVKQIPVVDLNEFDSLSSGAILITKYGYCKHSYAFKLCDAYPFKESGMNNESLAKIHNKVIERTLYDKNDGNIHAEKWYEFQNKIIKGE